MLDSDWLKKFSLRSDWLGPGIAYMTTSIISEKKLETRVQWEKPKN